MMKQLAVGIGAVLASDVAVSSLPTTLDFSGLPVRKVAGAFAGAYAANMLIGSGNSLWGTAAKALGALAAAELTSMYVPYHLAVGPVDAVRLASGAAGVWVANKLT